jgi:hypothetical protein
VNAGLKEHLGGGRKLGMYGGSSVIGISPDLDGFHDMFGYRASLTTGTRFRHLAFNVSLE